MIKRSNSILKTAEYFFAREPLRTIKGLCSAYIAYPVAEKLEKRNVTNKLDAIQNYYKKPFEDREKIIKGKLYEIVSFSKRHVPYYKDILNSIAFDPEKLRQDVRYLQDIPLLTKDIIREQNERLFSQPLNEVRHHICKTGGSTGLSCFIYYDQEAADYSSAVTLLSRDSVGNKKYKPELHFACRFLGEEQPDWPNREDFKCFAMNRSNIFFSSLDNEGLEEILSTLEIRRPYMIHAHPSTIYALACYVEKNYGSLTLFKIFESSGELLEEYMRSKIEKALNCKVINRYGLAELGVMAYQFHGSRDMFVYDSEGYPENIDHDNSKSELVFTGFRNKLMPLIRYGTGDIATVDKRNDGFFLTNVTGRIHDVVKLNGKEFPTHHIQDVLDHRVGGIQEFQIDTRKENPILRLVLELNAAPQEISAKIEYYWPNAFIVQFVNHEDFIRVGHRSKFRHVVDK